MKFVFIDYSEHYYRRIRKEELPGKREGKFIQVRGRGAEYLVLSPKAFAPYHANIAERFFLSQGLKGSYNHKRDHYLPRDGGVVGRWRGFMGHGQRQMETRPQRDFQGIRGVRPHRVGGKAQGHP